MDNRVGGMQVKLCDPSLKRANLSALERSIAHILSVSQCTCTKAQVIQWLSQCIIE